MYHDSHIRKDKCSNCGHAFVRCFLNFDILPLVEFAPENDISDQEALELIDEYPDGRDNTDIMDQDECFHSSINIALDRQQSCGDYVMIKADRETLRSFSKDEIFICSGYPKNIDLKENNESLNLAFLKKRYFKNMIPDVGIALSRQTNQFFHLEDFELAYLKLGRCPISRVKDIGNVSSFIF